MSNIEIGLVSLGVMVVLAIQFVALWNAGRGRRAVWRGRDYGIG